MSRVEIGELFGGLNLAPLWQETYGNPRVRIAVLDGKVDCSHPSLAGASVVQYPPFTAIISRDAPASAHGTHVASLIFGRHESAVPGLAPNCRGVLIPIFSAHPDGSLLPCSQFDLAMALYKAAGEGVQIINISASELSAAQAAEPFLVAAVQYCVSRGILIVAAAGNQGCSCLHVPAVLPSVLAVGAMDQFGNPMALSNWGEADRTHGILAPGKEVFGAQPAGGIGVASGTSSATAIVTGIAALLLSLQLKYGHRPAPLEIRQVLLDSAVTRPGDSPRVLAGRLDVMGAYARVLASLRQSPAQSSVSASPRRDSAGDRPASPGSSDHTTPSPFIGLYVPAERVVRERYHGILPERFGSVDVKLPDGSSYNVRDLHYRLDCHRRGMRLLPVADGVANPTLPGHHFSGHHIIDAFLRRQMALGDRDPIYALLSYIRPDEHSLWLTDLPKTKKVQLGHQHLGAYLGSGHTTHALERESGTTWWKDGRYYGWNVAQHPANVHLVSLQGVEQRTLNKNAQVVDVVLNFGILVPDNTQNITSRTINLNTMLQFYRDWIRGAAYLNDPTWYTNCSIHKTIVINVMLNLPHNERRFLQAFGDDGAELWRAFQAKYLAATGEEFTAADEIEFVPLWQLEGLDIAAVRPLTLEDSARFQAAKSEHRLASFTGGRPLRSGQGMAWPMETLADLVSGFMGLYVGFPDAGGITPALLLLALSEQITGRLGITSDQYLAVVKPIMAKLIVADALAHAPNDAQWLDHVTHRLSAALDGRAKDFNPSGRADVEILAEVDSYLVEARQRLDSIVGGRAWSVFEIADWLNRAVRPEIDRARELATADEERSGYFSTPGIIQRIAAGMYEKSRFVTIRTVCTATDHEELEMRFAAAQSRAADSIHAAGSSAVSLSPTARWEIGVSMSTQADPNTTAQAAAMPQSASCSCGNPRGSGSCDCGCKGSGGGVQLVYALGKVDYELASQSRRDSLKQNMAASARPEDREQLLAYLAENPWDASAVRWTLVLDDTPIFVIQPQGPFAKEAYDLLRQFLRERLAEGVERVSIPGVVNGAVQLRNGAVVPVVVPEIRGMYSWTTDALLASLGGTPPAADAAEEQKQAFAAVQTGVRNFLDRIYYELRNPGLAPHDRAINFAATNALAIERVYESAIRDEMELDSIDVQRSPIARTGTDSWDVIVTFFFPLRPVQTVRKVYRFTVDVSDVVPATVDAVRSWFIR